MRKVFLRADGDSQIGMGHVVRSIALGSMLNEVFDCYMLSTSNNDYVKSECKAAGIKFSELPKKDHRQAFLDQLIGEEIVVLDNYFFTSEDQKMILRKGCKLVCIDDIHSVHFHAHLVINHSPAAHASQYSKSNDTKLLLGLDYVLLRQSFLKYARRNQKKIKSKADCIFVCFGGADFQNLTLKYVMELIDKTKEDICIVVGAAYDHFEQLNEYAKKQERIHVYSGVDERTMIDLMEKSKKAIIPSSSILFEIIAMRVPFFTGFYADNQKEISSFFGENYPFTCLGNMVDYSKDQFDMIEDANYPESVFNLIDGFSHQRILDAFKGL